MPVRTLKRPSVLAASGLLVAAMVAVAAPALAAPVFIDDETYLDPYGSGYAYDAVGGAGCTYLSSGFSTDETPIVENGPAVTRSISGSATFGANDGNDTATGTASATGTGKVTSVRGNLASIDLKVTSRAKLTNALGTSPGCRRNMRAGVDLEFEFVVTRAGFLTTTVANRGSHSYGEVYIYRQEPGADNQPYLDTYGEGLKFNATTRTYLPAGTYRGYFEGQTGRYAQSSYDASSVLTAHAEFNVAGSRTSAVSGKGRAYVGLPKARSCTTHALLPKITSNRKRAKMIKSVQFLVNGKLVKTVRQPSKGQTVKLRIADGSTAKVKAVVRTFPRNEMPAKTLKVGTSYEACS